MRNRALLVRCDAPGCPAVELAVFAGSFWARDPVQELLNAGWTIHPGTDLCPCHYVANGVVVCYPNCIPATERRTP